MRGEAAEQERVPPAGGGGAADARDFYTVETITSGPECKCACVAPPSAVNPCAGEFRLKQLREAGKQNVKLSSILELLEGSFYGMDLLKLHSVTHRLMERMDRIEKEIRSPEQEAVPLNRTEDETPPTPPEGSEAPPTPLHPEEEVLGEVSRAAAFLNPEEKHDGKFSAGELLNRRPRRASARSEQRRLQRTAGTQTLLRGRPTPTE
ncbi:Olfactomedin-like protein 2B [Oryzias melastigma]|uniref:Olfactomedin-like protein 2B n=1 Tax=Oryzias melastigma TaxID=30732 RepID=A0A834CC47_ORYME|nr:Olfactomedin-like protein 2B [Oryzias melastigma]